MRRTPQQVSDQEGAQRGDWGQRRATDWNSEHRTWQQRGGYNGYRVPNGYFQSHFGEGHRFRIYGLPFEEIGGYPRFQYGGYWFSVLDPYPPYWGNNWYQNDNMYVGYVNNGYYLFNGGFPGRPGLAINISF